MIDTRYQLVASLENKHVLPSHVVESVCESHEACFSRNLSVVWVGLGGVVVFSEFFKLAPRHSPTQAFDSEGRFPMKMMVPF